jgi:hypothetical protein
MGLAIGNQTITFGANLPAVTVPALLLAGKLDTKTSPYMVSEAALSMLGTRNDNKQVVLIDNANHRHFDSGLCAQTQSSGAIAAANPRAILDLQTVNTILTFQNSGVAMDYCGIATFTSPTDITSLVEQLTRPVNGGPGSGFIVTASSVPTTGLTSDAVKDEVVTRAVAFFGIAPATIATVPTVATVMLTGVHRFARLKSEGAPKPEVKQQVEAELSSVVKTVEPVRPGGRRCPSLGEFFGSQCLPLRFCCWPATPQGKQAR